MRYFLTASGELVSMKVFFGLDKDACIAAKVKTDGLPDPDGYKVLIDCMDDREWKKIIGRGQDI